MKVISVFQATLRASRVLASASLVASAALLSVFAIDSPWLAANVGAWPPPLNSLSVFLLATGALLLSVPNTSARAAGQLLAIGAGAIALISVSQSWFGFWNGSDLWLFEDVVQRFPPGVAGYPGRITGAGGVLLAITSLALLTVPRSAQRTAPLFTFIAGTGLSLVAASRSAPTRSPDSGSIRRPYSPFRCSPACC